MARLINGRFIYSARPCLEWKMADTVWINEERLLRVKRSEKGHIFVLALRPKRLKPRPSESGPSGAESNSLYTS